MKSTKYFTRVYNDTKGWKVSQTLKKPEKEFYWFWPIIPHDLFYLVGILCFYFPRNLLLSSFEDMIWNSNQFKGRGYIFKSSIACHYLSGIFIFLKAKCPVFHFLDLVGQFWIWSKSLKRKPKCMCTDVFSFSSKSFKTLKFKLELSMK